MIVNTLSTNSNNKNKPGGTGGTTNNGTGSAVEAWQARTWPVSTATETGNLLSTEDYNRAAVEYDNLCDTVENGKFKDLKDLCWRHCTRVGCTVVARAANATNLARSPRNLSPSGQQVTWLQLPMVALTLCLAHINLVISLLWLTL